MKKKGEIYLKILNCVAIGGGIEDKEANSAAEGLSEFDESGSAEDHCK